MSKGSCQSGGKWYECTDSTPFFFGCCSSNPCSGLGCSTKDLFPASLGDNNGTEYPNVNCAQGRWYTCEKQSPTFQGCCASDPCQGGKVACPVGNLFAAAFDTVSSTTMTTSSTSSSISKTSTASVSPSTAGVPTSTTSTTIPSPTFSSSTSPTSSDSAPNHNIGKIVGIAIGATIGCILALGLLYLLIRRHSTRKAARTPRFDTPESLGHGTDAGTAGSGSHYQGMVGEGSIGGLEMGERERVGGGGEEGVGGTEAVPEAYYPGRPIYGVLSPQKHPSTAFPSPFSNSIQTPNLNPTPGPPAYQSPHTSVSSNPTLTLSPAEPSSSSNTDTHRYTAISEMESPVMVHEMGDSSVESTPREGQGMFVNTGRAGGVDGQERDNRRSGLGLGLDVGVGDVRELGGDVRGAGL